MLDTSQVNHARLMEIAGIASRSEFRDRRALLGIGRTERGLPKRLTPYEATLFLIMARLQDHGLGRSAAAAVARKIKVDDLAPIIAKGAERWLLARPDERAEEKALGGSWIVTVAAPATAERILLNSVRRPEAYGSLTMLPLKPVVEQVFLAALADKSAAGHA